MKFGEQFPSLNSHNMFFVSKCKVEQHSQEFNVPADGRWFSPNRKIIYVPTQVEVSLIVKGSNENVSEFLIDKKEVEKHCLDKQKVKDAINELCFHKQEEIYKKTLLLKLGLTQ